ncbi:Box C/D snoRNA protein 1 [Atta colombica]|uniref:Box C/D snoRNA protein 1 n=1 Tax=Atta colombica TaxID=520822 RepID=A0A195BSA9_9HYME|nr:PREDICTED: box C/D snoRNA protein 1 [Atta colombica]KYM89905.1 Box C/D snoRNA protein 1 [Atta colombica]
MAAIKNKLENCEVCDVAKARYTCPKCEVRTCSLTCVNVHKKELECDGIRDPTKFVPLASFTDLDLLSDYRFLEQVGRSIDTKKRNPEIKYTRQTILPVHLHKLRCAASHRKVSLLYMPQVFSRHKQNTTYLNWKTNELFWRLEWIFPQAENIKYTIDRTLDSVRLSTLVEQVLDPVSATDEIDIEKLNTKLLLADKLQFYRAAGLTNIKVLLKAEKIKKAQFRFYDLDVTLTLQENLENKTIVEFPTLHVVMKDHSNMYDIIDTDEEMNDAECTSYGAKKRYNNRSDDNKKNEPVNYFFNDFSDSDDENTDNKVKKKKKSLNIPNYEELIKM